MILWGSIRWQVTEAECLRFPCLAAFLSRRQFYRALLGANVVRAAPGPPPVDEDRRGGGAPTSAAKRARKVDRAGSHVELANGETMRVSITNLDALLSERLTPTLTMMAGVNVAVALETELDECKWMRLLPAREGAPGVYVGQAFSVHGHASADAMRRGEGEALVPDMHGWEGLVLRYMEHFLGGGEAEVRILDSWEHVLRECLDHTLVNGERVLLGFSDHPVAMVRAVAAPPEFRLPGWWEGQAFPRLLVPALLSPSPSPDERVAPSVIIRRPGARERTDEVAPLGPDEHGACPDGRRESQERRGRRGLEVLPWPMEAKAKWSCPAGWRPWRPFVQWERGPAAQ